MPSVHFANRERCDGAGVYFEASLQNLVIFPYSQGILR